MKLTTDILNLENSGLELGGKDFADLLLSGCDLLFLRRCGVGGKAGRGEGS